MLDNPKDNNNTDDILSVFGAKSNKITKYIFAEFCKQAFAQIMKANKDNKIRLRRNHMTENACRCQKMGCIFLELNTPCNKV